MTTKNNPKNVRLALIAKGIDTNLLNIVPSSYGVLITAVRDDDETLALIGTVLAVLRTIPGMSNFTHRAPGVIKIHNR